jgi:two-component system CheB/CheR fusion protein
MGIAVAVLDAGQTVRVWNRHAEELWGIRPAEIVGQRVWSLDADLPVPELQGCIRSALSGDASEVVVGAHDRRGRQLLCRVGAVPLAVEGDAVTGVILVMERVAA